MKVTTDGCLFGAWVSSQESLVGSHESGKSHESIVFSRESGSNEQQARREQRVASSEQRAAHNPKLLDIGCGTGLLSLMIAQKNSHLHIDAVEIDEAAAQQATENSAASPWKERVNVIHSDIKNYYPANEGKYDFVVCNPPFYENELSSPDAKKNKAHHDGSLLLEETVQAIRHSLKPGGRFYLLLPAKRIMDIQTLLQNAGLAITETVTVKQTPSHSFFRVMITGIAQNENPVAVHSSELTIKDSKGNYTPGFTALLKEYYLYL